ncbi:hypothetical protein ACQPXB_36765 [Amycolatopsis sp. CA-161197]|uniref:hypothetical protein n=1 Tax=Amycolatopsis sp. CA-161197 TaxID=3239922 RepID=UPI003D8DC2CE
MARRWGTIDLLDILKNTEFTGEFASVATRENLPATCCAAGCRWPFPAGQQHGHPAEGRHR